MPFIAIALALSLFIGGSAVVAENTTQGHTAAHNVVHAWNSFAAKVTGHADADTDTQVDADAQATSTTSVQHGLMIRTDATGTEQGPALNADGSVKVNVF